MVNKRETIYFTISISDKRWLGARAPPPPPPTREKSSAQKCPKEERKFHPDMSAKKKCARSAQMRQTKTKKVGKKELSNLLK